MAGWNQEAKAKMEGEKKESRKKREREKKVKQPTEENVISVSKTKSNKKKHLVKLVAESLRKWENKCCVF